MTAALSLLVVISVELKLILSAKMEKESFKCWSFGLLFQLSPPQFCDRRSYPILAQPQRSKVCIGVSLLPEVFREYMVKEGSTAVDCSFWQQELFNSVALCVCVGSRA